MENLYLLRFIITKVTRGEIHGRTYARTKIIVERTLLNAHYRVDDDVSIYAIREERKFRKAIYHEISEKRFIEIRDME